MNRVDQRGMTDAADSSAMTFRRRIVHLLKPTRCKFSILACSLFAFLTLFAAALWLAVRFVPYDASTLGSREISSMVFDRNGLLMRSYLGNDERWRIPVPLKDVSPWLIKATLAVEDKRFREHGGVDWIAIGRALLSNIRHGGVVSGASTISMQVAGLEDQPRRTVWRKLRQAFHALQLERQRTKDEILELYLTHAPYGGNICGVEAAARRYFNKNSSEVSLSEAALIAGLPQSPTRFRPDRNPEAAMKRRGHVLDRMVACGAISHADYNRAASGRPKVGAFDAPMEAPHFCEYVHSRYGSETNVRTTLDLSIQHQAEKILAQKVRGLGSRGVTNGSAVVLDNATGDILAMVGSVSYNDAFNSGQVNGATSPRSPASALKPLIYAMAFDTGTLLPKSVLYDVPQQYLGYEPENFDRQFQGLVPAAKALAWSLNVPAIQVLQQVGLERALQTMRDCGLGTLNAGAGEYGLSLAIGTCSVRLLDLSNAYAMIARGGEYRETRALLKDGGSPIHSPVNASRLLKEAACYFVTRALSDNALRPPEGIDPALLGLEGVAWKTGTSSGFHDAWTIAYDKKYTVGVWVGNLNGQPSRALVGSQAAAPVALGIIQHLRPADDANAGWPRRPADLGSIIVCAETGLPPGPDCPTTCTADALPPSSGAKPPICSVHRKLKIDAETGEQLCPRCIAGRSREERVFDFWPAPVASWLAKEGIATANPPAHFHDCITQTHAAGPRITSPKPGDSFIVSSARDLSAQKLSLEAAAPPPGKKLFWFLDGDLVQAADIGAQLFLAPKPGRHTVRCTDEFGRSDIVAFNVEQD